MPAVRTGPVRPEAEARVVRQRAWMLLGLAAISAPVLGAGDHRSGTGSQTDNPDLYAPPLAPEALALPGLRDSYAPFFDIDWSIGASVGVQQGTGGKHIETDITPSATLTHQGRRLNFGVSADTGIARIDDGEIAVSALRLAFAADYLLDSVTQMSATGSLDISRLSDIDPTLSSSLSQAPQIITGSLGLEVNRQMGKLAVKLNGDIGRSVYGDSLSDTGEVVTNGSQNVTDYGLGLRLSYELTPVLSGFVEASAERSFFDMAELGHDNTTYALRAGLSGNWQDVWQVEGSVGVGLLHYDDEGRDEVTSTLYGASLSFQPDETLKVSAGLSTSIAPPTVETGEGTRIDYQATGDVSYMVNRWLALRANAAWSQTVLAESQDKGNSGYSLGLGADYLVNSHAKLSADYGFTHVEQIGETPDDVHKVTLGVTVSR